MALTVLLALASQWTAPEMTGERWRRVAAGAIWFAGGYAVTVFLPIRSSLYAVFPSVGAAIVCGTVVESIRAYGHTAQNTRRRLPLEAVVAVALIAAVPIYRDRNGRWVEPARLSQRALRIIAADAAALPERGTIVLHDVLDPASSFAGAFGTLATEAVQLHTRRNLRVRIEPAPPEWRTAGASMVPRSREYSTQHSVKPRRPPWSK